MRSIILTLILLAAAACHVVAQVTFSGELRPRTEYSHGFGTLAGDFQDASLFTSQRTRLSAQFKNDLLSSRVVLQDVRLWGAQAQLTGNEDFAVSIHEAWAETGLVGKLYLKAGRQELVYDDSRILGNVGWAQQGRTHDVAVLKWLGEAAIHLGFAFHQNANRQNNIFDGNDAYKSMQFLWLNKKQEDWSASLLLLNNGVPLHVAGQGQETIYSQTLGTHVKYRPAEKIQLNLNAYYQTGELVLTGVQRDLSAYNLLAEVLYNAEEWQFTAGYEMLSGDDVNNSTVGAFNPLYGTNHKFNGHMDYFYVGNHLNSAGLGDAYLKAALSREKISTALHVHFFSTAGDIGLSEGAYLGTEADWSLTWTIHPNASLAVGYSQLFASEKMELLKGGNANETQNWAWLMLTFGF